MMVPLVLGSLVGTFTMPALEIGSFTTALFKDSALPLIALLIFMTGTQVTGKTGGPVLAPAGVVLLMNSLIPAALVVALGSVVGIDGILGISVLALLLVTAILAPILVSFLLKRAGALKAGDDELEPVSETAQEDPAVATADRCSQL